MQLKSIILLLKIYRQYIENEERYKRAYIWESQQVFVQKWDINAVDMKAMYLASLDNSRSRRLWNRENFEPRKVMAEILGHQPDYGRMLFSDLLNEERDLTGRLHRFVYGCNELFSDYLDSHVGSRLQSHFHTDNFEMAFLYLAFRYPEKYSFYHPESFKYFLEETKARDIPEGNDPDRFVKVVNMVNVWMQKEPNLWEIHLRRLNPTTDYTKNNLLWVYDFFLYVQEKNINVQSLLTT